MKNDRVDASGKIEGGGAAAGYGNVPFSRDEYTAEQITAYFNLDLAQIRAYGLGQEVERLLIALALFKIRKFLVEGLRLRTACDLDLVSLKIERPKDDFVLPELSDVSTELPSLIQAVAAKSLFADPAATVVTWSPKTRRAQRSTQSDA